MCSTGHVRNGILFIGRVWRTAKRRKRTCVGALRSKWGSCSSRGVWRIAKRDSTGYYSSTVDLLQPPPATVHPRDLVHPTSTACSFTVYCSTSPLHEVLFNHPSTSYYSSSPPPATVQPAIHGVLFIQPSTGSCSSSPSRGPVHPPPTGSIDQGPVHPAATPRAPVHPTPHRELFIQTPQQRSLFIQRQHRSASVSSSSEGIARSGLVNSHRSIARVQ